MTKKDLKNGMIVELRNGTRYLYCEGVMRGLNAWELISYYTDNLKCPEFPQLDIVKVYEDTRECNLNTIFEYQYLEPIWQRPEVALSEQELEILKALDVLGYKYIVKNMAEEPFAYIARPVKNKSSWLFNGNVHPDEIETIKLKRESFAFITWADKEPTSIKKLLEQVKEKEND